MAANKPIRVLVAQAQALIRECLVCVVEREADMVVVAEASRGEEAVSLYRQHRPDVLLMGLDMPDMDGIAVMKAIRSEFPDAKILVLSRYGGDQDVQRALRSGANGYLLEQASVQELKEAIHTVAAGKCYLAPQVASQLEEHLHQSPLTERELEVLQLVAQGKSNQEIANTFFIVEGTVKSHVNSIFYKLGVTDRTQAVVTALKRGIIRLR